MIDGTQGPSSLPEAFDAMVAAFPDRIAVTDLASSLSYRQLAVRVDSFAATISAQGLRAGQPVGLCAGRTVDLIAAMLAILKAGCPYVPLPPDYPLQRLKQIADHLALPAIVCDSVGADVAAGLATKILQLAVVAEVEQRRDIEPLMPELADQLCYIMFTSGSTGQPKGVMIEHRNVLALLSGCAAHFDLDEHHVWAMAHSYAFDFSVWEIWGALAHGGTLLVVPSELVREPEAFWTACVEQSVTVLSATPSYFNHLVAAVEGRLPEGSLRYVVFGGETLIPASLSAWFDKFDERGPQLVNMYGITETTVHATVHPLTAAAVQEQASVIGRPLPHLSIALLDQDGRQVPDGAIGEMYVAGAALARGYHGEPELTADRFVIDAASGQRHYRSGDLARRRPDGVLEYLGRSDLQLKVRGFRVEPEEIEACLLRHGDIRQAAVLGRPDDPDGSLIGYYVANQELPPASIKAYLAEQLPEFMVPALLVQLARLPMTVNGKLDRAALTAPLARAGQAAAGGTPEVGGPESWLKSLWQDELGLGTVDPDEDFFALGGNSLMAMRVVRQCREHGLPLRASDLYGHPTLRELTTLLRTRAEAGG